MYVVTVVFQIRPDAVAAFLPLMLENARASFAQEPGCLRFDVCQDDAEHGRIFLYEIYSDRAAFEAHLGSGHFRAFSAASAPLVADKRVETWSLLEPGSKTSPEQRL